jgi:pimeloyl-ACP methyl ester carboxylesterase
MRSAAFLSLLLVLHAVAGEEPVPPGKLVDIGGYRLHLYSTGNGRQTVLLSPGGGDFSFDWYLVPQKRAYRGLSANSKIVEDAIAGHSVHLEDPDTVVSAIRDVIDAAQRHTQLSP